MIEAMKQALEALEKLEKHNRGVKITTVKTGEVIHPAQIAQDAITSLRQAIAEADKQYPFGMYGAEDLDKAWKSGYDNCKAQRQWVGLTPDEIMQLMDSYDVESMDYVYAIQDWLKEKNT